MVKVLILSFSVKTSGSCLLEPLPNQTLEQVTRELRTAIQTYSARKPEVILEKYDDLRKNYLKVRSVKTARSFRKRLS